MCFQIVMHEGLEGKFINIAREFRFHNSYELMHDFAQKVHEFSPLSIEANRYKAQALVEQFKENTEQRDLLRDAITHLDTAYHQAQQNWNDQEQIG